MADRVLDFADDAAYLHVRNDQLLVERDGTSIGSIPCAEIAVIILAHPRVVCSQSVFAALMTHGGAVVTCDAQHLPAGLLLPTAAHFAQAERFAAQAAAPLPRKKRAWQQIVRHKIRGQAALLADLDRSVPALTTLAATVRSGDPQNVEAQAARRYWAALFPNLDFRRRRDGPGPNHLLNYGYAVLRAVVARALCAAGLHPSLGVHHHNRYNAFCLADDLMEPYRPLVDAAVVEIVGCYGADAPLSHQTKQGLLELILTRFDVAHEVRSLFDIAARTASSLAGYFTHTVDRVWYPRELRRASR